MKVTFLLFTNREVETTLKNKACSNFIEFISFKENYISTKLLLKRQKQNNEPQNIKDKVDKVMMMPFKPGSSTSLSRRPLFPGTPCR